MDNDITFDICVFEYVNIKWAIGRANDNKWTGKKSDKWRVRQTYGKRERGREKESEHNRKNFTEMFPYILFKSIQKNIHTKEK